MMKAQWFVLVALFVPACAPLEEETAPPRVAYAQTIIYNFYFGSASTTAPGSACVAPAPATPPPVRTTGFVACDRLLDKSEQCVESLTSDTGARARFERALDRVRAADWDVAQHGDIQARTRVVEKCEAALAAYGDAPCTADR